MVVLQSNLAEENVDEIFYLVGGHEVWVWKQNRKNFPVYELEKKNILSKDRQNQSFTLERSFSADSKWVLEKATRLTQHDSAKIASLGFQ